MPINLFGKAAFAGSAIMVAQSASAAVYDFKAAGNAGGSIGVDFFDLRHLFVCRLHRP